MGFLFETQRFQDPPPGIAVRESEIIDEGMLLRSLIPHHLPKLLSPS
jgi:hypothetical protein